MYLLQLVHTSLATADASAFPLQLREKMLKTAVDQLPKSSRDAYFSLAASMFDEALNVIDIIKTNAFELFVKDSRYAAIFPEPSRMNHDCAPNAIYYLDSVRLAHVVHATRDIAPEEEITISYVSPLERAAKRQEFLGRAFGFVCTCKRCRSSHESDGALREIEQLQDRLQKSWSAGNVQEPENDVDRLIELYEEQRLHGYLDVAYGHAALTHKAKGNMSKAKEFAVRAREVLRWKVKPGAKDMELWDRMLEGRE